MSLDTTSKSRIHVVVTFLVAWLITSILIAALSVGNRYSPAYSENVRGVGLILIPNFIPAALIGYLLGPKLIGRNFLRSIGWQLLYGFLWVLIATGCLYIVLFNKELGQVLSGSESVRHLFIRFVLGIPIFGVFFSFAIFPCTLIASSIAFLLLRKTKPVHA